MESETSGSDKALLGSLKRTEDSGKSGKDFLSLPEQTTKTKLINFEKEISELFEQAKIPYVVHFCGGNEEQLIKIFKDIKKEDYKFSAHRAHYHYLLSGGSPEVLKDKIMKGKSMYIYDRKLNFFTSPIVGGIGGIAAGVALALKRKRSNRHVWCFVGDGAEDEGHFYEAVRYVEGHDLPCTFIIEDDGYAVDTPKKARYGENSEIKWGKHVIRYYYKRTYPHVGIGKWVTF